MQRHEFQKLTLEEFLRFTKMYPEHRYEWVDGYIRMMSHGSPAHGLIMTNMGALLLNSLRRQKSQCNVYTECSLLYAQRYYIPDLMASCDLQDQERPEMLEAPRLVIEILSEGTLKRDKLEKLDWYQAHPSIEEILYIDSRKKHVEHYQRISSFQWKKTLYIQDEQIITLTSINVNVPLAEIYYRVRLEEAN